MQWSKLPTNTNCQFIIDKKNPQESKDVFVGLISHEINNDLSDSCMH